MSLHHKLCHALGGKPRPAPCTDPRRGPPACPGLQPGGGACSSRGTASSPLGVADPARGLWDLAGTPRCSESASRTSEWTRQDIEPIADQVVANPYANPAPVTRDGVIGLLRAAWAGEPPTT